MVDPSFVRSLHSALVHLYDPGELRKSPLVSLLGVDGRPNPTSALQRVLIEAIAALKPPADVPAQSNAWRAYRVLFHRFTEQCTQVEVATTLGLSERQLRREEHQAIRLLAEHLWMHYGVQLRMATVASGRQEPAEPEATLQAATPSREEELEWLRQSASGEVADAVEAIQAALKTAAPLLDAPHTRVTASAPENLPRLAIPPSVLRQALLSILTACARLARGGELRLRVCEGDRRVEIRVETSAAPAASALPCAEDAESLRMAAELVGLSGGTLALTHATPGHPFAATLSVPTAEQAAVLVIDDNADTLRLFQRCLAGTRYPFIGAQNPEHALELAERLRPRIIVLDLMLPGLDGWEMLGRLREHPRTRGVPIVVCSILPQEQLALTLGAAAFIRKPVTRAALLSVLDQLVGQRLPRLR